MADRKLVEYVIAASVREPEEKEYEELSKNPVVRNIKLAARDIGVNGKPRMLLITAWMVHEGRNDNGQAFVRAELEQAVRDGLFAPPYSGMIDFNHDFIPRGFWFKTSFAFHDEADRWGVLAQGAIWAWRYPELTDHLIAEQERKGHIVVSMSALPESVEITSNHPEAEGEFTQIIHNSVFTSASLLDVPPGDINAIGNVSEKEVPGVPTLELQAASAGKTQLHSHQEDIVMEELKTVLEEVRKQREEAIENLGQVREQLSVAERSLVETKTEAESLSEQIATLKTELENVKTKKSELEIALETANKAKAEAEEELGQIKTQNEEFKTKIQEFETAKVEAEKDARLHERVESLPDDVKVNLEDHSEKDALQQAWREMSDEEFETVRSSFALAARRKGVDYVERSKREGKLSTAASTEEESPLSKYIRS